MNFKSYQIDKVLFFLIYTGLLILMVIPLALTNNLYYPYVTLKNFSFRFILEIISVCWFILILRNKDFFPKFPPLYISVMLFIAILAFSNALGIDPGLSMWGNLERMDGLITLIHLFTYMLIASSILKTNKQWAILANASILIALIIGAIGIGELSKKSSILIASTLGNSGYLATYSLFHLFLAAFLYIKNKEKKLSLIYLLFVIFFSVVIYNTGSRGSLLAVLVGATVSLMIYKKKNLRKSLFYGVILLVLSGVTLWSFKSSNFVQNSQTLKRIVDIDSASSTRLKLWKISIQAIKEKPLLGWGQENFHYVFDRFYDSTLGGVEPWFDRAHNTFLDWTIAAGLPGLIAYLSIFFAALFSLWKYSENEFFTKVEKSVLSGLLIAYALNNFFTFDSISTYLMFFSLLAFISNSEFNEKMTLPKSRQAGIFFIIFCLISFLSYCFYFVNLPALKTARGIAQAITYKREGQALKAIEKIEEVSSIDSFAKKESYEQLSNITPTYKTLALLKDSAHTRPLSLKKSYIYLATAAQLEHLDIEDIFIETIALSPRRQSVYQVMIYYYLKQNNFVKAFEYSKLSYEINQEINRSKSMYALCAVLVGDIKLSEELILNMPTEYYIENKLFIEAYEAIKRKDKLIDFYKKSAFVYPLEPDNHLKLGKIYQEIGRNTDAELEFELSRKLTQRKLAK